MELVVLGKLVEADEVERGALIFVGVVPVLHRPESESRAAWERPPTVLPVPARFSVPEPLVTERDERALLEEVGVVPAEEDRRIAGDVDVAQSGGEKRDRLASARGAAVERLTAVERVERLLLGAQCPRDVGGCVRLSGKAFRWPLPRQGLPQRTRQGGF